MPVKPWTDDRRARVREAIVAEEARRPAPPRPEVVNTAEAAALDDPAYRIYRGRVYRVAPIPYKAGLRLHRGVDAYREATKAGSQEGQEAALDGLVSLYRQLARPIGWRRLVAWALPNPFRHASEKEIIALADFFWTCRTGQSLLDSAPQAAGRPRRSTGSSTSMSSSGSGGASRPHGGTTSTA